MTKNEVKLARTLADSCCVYSAKEVTAEVIEEAKSQGKTVIGTHSGTHHCDEVISCSLLSKLYPSSIIVRHRDAAILGLCDIVVDVGGEYDVEKKLFDHHQNTFSTTWSAKENCKIRLSSAGLIWKHYGEQLIKLRNPSASVDGQLVESIYHLLFESIDAGDNGTKACECKPEEINYIGAMPGMAGLVGSCNTSWIVWESESKCFKNALRVIEERFIPILYHFIDHLEEAFKEIRSAPRIPLPNHPESFVIELKEFYLFGKFFRFVLKDQPEVVGAIWSSPVAASAAAGVAWSVVFRPARWLERYYDEKLGDDMMIQDKQELLKLISEELDRYNAQKSKPIAA